jgi:hypothetical protein
LQVNTTLQFVEFIEDYNEFYDKVCEDAYYWLTTSDL